ncbi:TonB-dependent receptor [Aureibaculum sp. 2210JD6-5]|uniref:TonB-dependent receptor domain-containing protein n=1 Tax=Aureibaculum sp. 2210JD6-5 TaxID=3103957 RepID=UPI002AAE64BF|nr:TonB-dependent receptor [Aureibaculum sp. 2210JD6-5]MDY7394697.1 TonB-dependent receptor [Aureibaculum sp. 2210JD6-5]
MKKYISTLIILLVTTITFAQVRKKDTIGTEVINVVKSYTPTVSDAFKIKSSPEIDTNDINVKKPISYSIFSIPVASTFTPAKGKAKVLKVNPSPQVYDNYISAGFGNFSTPGVELFVHGNSNRYNDFGAFFNFISSKGGINNVVLDDNYFDSRLDLFYKQEERDFDWQINAGGRMQKYNWYGLPEKLSFSQNMLDNIDEEVRYTEIYAGGKIDYKDSFFQGGTVESNRFTDDQGSAEIHFLAKPEIEFPIASEYINADVRLEFLRGKFLRNYNNTSDLKYTFFNIGFNPSLEILRNNLTVNLGVKLLYSSGSGSGNENKGYYYPNVTASYKLIDEVLTLYGGVTGDLHQNSFKGFADENPYVSPTLTMKRTDEQYNGFFGLKGKLASNIGYNFKASYSSERDKPLYKLNPSKTEGATLVDYGYEAGNSFGIVYDTIQTINGFAEVTIDLSKQLKLGGNAEFNQYNTKNEEKAWNLPALKVSAFANYNNENWFAGANIFYVGSRKDEISTPIHPATIITVGDYVDLNLNGGYKFNEKLTVFAKVNNLLSSDYQKYTNYYVQGLQVFGGLTYKFDF